MPMHWRQRRLRDSSLLPHFLARGYRIIVFRAATEFVRRKTRRRSIVHPAEPRCRRHPQFGHVGSRRGRPLPRTLAVAAQREAYRRNHPPRPPPAFRTAATLHRRIAQRGQYLEGQLTRRAAAFVNRHRDQSPLFDPVRMFLPVLGIMRDPHGRVLHVAQHLDSPDRLHRFDRVGIDSHRRFQVERRAQMNGVAGE
jgi:hypothetical protein